jgi:hypothetical protein
MAETTVRRDIIVLFGPAALAVVSCDRARPPTMVGLIMTGAFCGPFGFSAIPGEEPVRR